MSVRTVFSAVVQDQSNTRSIHVQLQNWANEQDQSSWVSHRFYLLPQETVNPSFNFEIISHHGLTKEQKEAVIETIKTFGLTSIFLFVNPDPAS
ncbi:MAG TPA: hypothetical protein PLI45_04490 [Candidatus Woesebacteria bacterium]|nr:hypothetical protein [Candidatus Woesebacteria bacterium]